MPNQRNDLMIERKPELSNCHRVANHNNFIKEFWIRTYKLKAELQQKCCEYDIDHEGRDKGAISKKVGD